MSHSITLDVKTFYRLYHGVNDSMITDQFNPFMRESTPPLLIDASAESHETWGWCLLVPCVMRAWTTVMVHVLDVAPYTVTVFKADMPFAIRTFSGAGDAWFVAEIDIDYWSDSLLDYTIRADAQDVAGNKLDPVWEKRVDGPFAGVLRFFEWLASVAAAIADLVMRALSFLVDWIVQQFSNAIRSMVEALSSLVGAEAGEAGNEARGLASRSGLSEWGTAFILMPLLGVVWKIKQKLEDTFSVMETIEAVIHVIISATGLGSIIHNAISKITMESVKKALTKLAIAVALGKIIEDIMSAMNKDAVESLIFQVFDFTAAVTVILAMIEVLERLSRNEKGIPKSKYATAAALAIAALVLETVSYPLVQLALGSGKGTALLAIDFVGGALAFTALIFLAAKRLLKFKPSSPFIDGMADFLAPTTSGVEQILTVVAASSTFVAIGAHCSNKEWGLPEGWPCGG